MKAGNLYKIQELINNINLKGANKDFALSLMKTRINLIPHVKGINEKLEQAHKDAFPEDYRAREEKYNEAVKEYQAAKEKGENISKLERKVSKLYDDISPEMQSNNNTYNELVKTIFDEDIEVAIFPVTLEDLLQAIEKTDRISYINAEHIEALEKICKVE